jgi:hypothetical protein
MSGRSLPTKAKLSVEVVRTYLTARAAMKADDLPVALEHLRTRAPGRPPGAVDVEESRALGRAVCRTLTVLPTDSRCLIQALVLTRMLAQRGQESTLVIAVRRGEEFLAHAWVEVDGAPVLDPGGADLARMADL